MKFFKVCGILQIIPFDSWIAPRNPLPNRLLFYEGFSNLGLVLIVLKYILYFKGYL